MSLFVEVLRIGVTSGKLSQLDLYDVPSSLRWCNKVLSQNASKLETRKQDS